MAPRTIRLVRHITPQRRFPAASFLQSQHAMQPVSVIVPITHRNFSSETIGSSSSNNAVFEPVSSSVAQTAVAQIGDLKAMGLCSFTPVGALEAFLEAINVTTGLPWWGTIAATTILVRFALLPIVVRVQRNAAALQALNPQVNEHMAQIQAAQLTGDVDAVRQQSQELQALFKKNNCHPFLSFTLPLVQMPVMVSFFMALKSMSELPVPGFQTGGLAWFADLAVSDPYYILPFISGASMLSIMETASREATATSPAAATNPQLQKKMKNLFRLLAVATVPFTAWMPSVSFFEQH